MERIKAVKFFDFECGVVVFPTSTEYEIAMKNVYKMRNGSCTQTLCCFCQDTLYIQALP